MITTESSIINRKNNSRSITTDFTTVYGNFGFKRRYHQLLPEKLNVFKNVLPKIDKIENDSVKSQVIYFIQVFEEILISRQQQINSIGQLPVAMLNIENDGAVLLEWGFRDFKIGFSFELNEKESSWFIVTKNSNQDFASSSEMPVENIPALASHLISFVASNT